jgi:hypothetical protein
VRFADRLTAQIVNCADGTVSGPADVTPESLRARELPFSAAPLWMLQRP